MLSVTQTQFRNHIRKYLDEVQRGEEIEIRRNGRHIATVVGNAHARAPHWKQPREPLVIPGVSVSKMIIEEREEGW